jgi:hypothetical protein
MGRKRRDQVAKEDVLVRERRGGRGRKLALLLAVAGAATWLVRRNHRKAELDEGIWHEASAPAAAPPSAVPTS